MADPLQQAKLELARREAAKRGLSAETPSGPPPMDGLRATNVGGALSDTALQIGSSAIATPIAGIEGIASGVEFNRPTPENPVTISGNPLKTLDNFFDFNFDKARDAIDNRISSMTISPRSELGSKATGFIGEQAGKLDQATDDAALDFSDGDPGKAALAKALPLVALEAAGIKGASAVRPRPNLSVVGRDLPAPRPELPSQLPPPSTASMLKAGGDLFDEARRFGSRLSPDSVDGFRDSLSNMKGRNGLSVNVNKKLHPESHAVMKEAMRVTENGASFDDMLQLRQIAGDAAGSVNAKDARIAAMIRDNIDNYFDGLKSGDMIGGNPEKAAAAFKEANSTWRRAREAQFFERLIEKANNDVSANYSQAGLETAIKRRVKNELNSDTRSRRFSPETKAAMQRLVDGDNVGNFLRFVGRAAPRGIISGILAPAAATSMFGPAGMAIAGIGEIAKRASATRTINQADDLVDIAKSSGLLGK